MKKKILIVYYEMMLGGSTTSLLSLLHSFDYDKYDVDLLLYHNCGPFLKYIPEEVNLLPQAMEEITRIDKIVRTLLNGELFKTYYKGLKYYKKFKRAPQQSAYMQTTLCRRIEKQYDVAIGFMELWSDVYVNKCVNATKKISWIHVDYEKAHYVPAIDRHTYDESDYVVNVSDACLDNFNRSFPQLRDRTVVVENILTRGFVQKRKEAATVPDIQLSADSLNLLSVCRLAIDHKGLDRGLEAISNLVRKGYKISWHIVGDGPDREIFTKMIQEKQADSFVVLHGSMECPFGLYDKFDAFVLPSRFEGKPMAITEAQMLGIPPIVTEYTSASEQILHGHTGLISENDTYAFEQMIESVYNNRNILEGIRKELEETNFDNDECIMKIYSLMK